MAGSYQHCTNDDGSFRDEDFTGMIENLGDAHEACHMMHWMIGFLADWDDVRIEHASESYFAAERLKHQPSSNS